MSYIAGSLERIEYTWESRAAVALAFIDANVDALRTLGYATPGDGGGALYKRVGSEPSHAGKVQSADGAWWEIADSELKVKSFGALGNGTTDDSAAIIAADAAAAAQSKSVRFNGGSYAANALTQTAGWNMDGDAKILYNGASNGECVRNNATGIISGRIVIDCDAKEPRTAYYLEGDSNQISYIEVINVISNNQAWVVRSVYVTGDNNLINHAVFRDLVNTGNTNDSSPQAFVTDSTADGNDVRYIYANNCRSSVTNAATGKNTYGTIVSRSANDNGFYSVAGTATVDEVVYQGNDNAVGFRSSANVSIGEVHLLEVGSTAIFFGDCGDISIGHVFCHDIAHPVLHLNLADTGRLSIGSITGTMVDTEAFAMPRDSGDVEYLSIGNVDLKATLTASYAGTSTRSFARLDAAFGLYIGNFRLDIVCNGYTPTAPFYVRIRDALSTPSFIDRLRFELLQSDGVTPNTSVAVFGVGINSGGSNTAFAQQNLRVSEGCFNTSAHLRPYGYSGFVAGVLTASAAPTAGYWRVGDTVWDESPASASAMGWRCTVSGSPGTWVAMANMA